jgi:hypothetical protein
VFSLANSLEEFEASSLPQNPNSFSIDASQLIDTVITIEKTQSQKYRKIVVQGERMVTCATFAVDSLWDDTDNETTPVRRGSEQSYKHAVAELAVYAETNDLVRQSDAFHNVYSAFYVPYFGDEEDGEYFEGKFPAVANDGWVLYDEPNIPLIWNSRKTLPWTPLQVGVDYSSLSGFDADQLGDDLEPGDDKLLPLSAWINTKYEDSEWKRYAPAEMLGFEVSPREMGLGLNVRGNPRHILAGTDFDDANPSLIKPKYDWKRMLVTLAFESGERLSLTEVDDEADESDGTIIISVPEAHLWYVAENAIYGVSHDSATGGELLRTNAPLVVRNDREKLARVMAGAIARYHRNRYRARIQVRGVALWQEYLGNLIECINDGTEDTAELKSPITSVEWEFEQSYRSSIRTGYSE